jgi:hypothetical protein
MSDRIVLTRAQLDERMDFIQNVENRFLLYRPKENPHNTEKSSENVRYLFEEKISGRFKVVARYELNKMT